MPRSRCRIGETEYPSFLTGTGVGWLPVFTRPEAVPIVFALEGMAAAVKGREVRESKVAKTLATLQALSRKEGVPLAIVDGSTSGVCDASLAWPLRARSVVG